MLLKKQVSKDIWMKCVIIKKVMTPAQIQSIYKVYSENAVTNIDITVDTSKEVREISKAMFGINHRYHNNAYSSWNASEKKVEAKFNEYVKRSTFWFCTLSRWNGIQSV